MQEDRAVLEEFMDHKRDFYVHQVSIRPKVENEYATLTFILQANCKYGGA